MIWQGETVLAPDRIVVWADNLNAAGWPTVPRQRKYVQTDAEIPAARREVLSLLSKVLR